MQLPQRERMYIRELETKAKDPIFISIWLCVYQLGGGGGPFKWEKNFEDLSYILLDSLGASIIQWAGLYTIMHTVCTRGYLPKYMHML